MPSLRSNNREFPLCSQYQSLHITYVEELFNEAGLDPRGEPTLNDSVTFISADKLASSELKNHPFL